MPAPRTPLETCLPDSTGKKRGRKGRLKIPQKPPGRPKTEIDLALVVDMAQRHSTNKEIAATLGISVDTLDRRCAELIKTSKFQGKGRLRTWMWKGAENGDTKMQIFLSKQHLGMRDKQDINTTAETTTVKVLHGVSMEDL